MFNVFVCDVIQNVVCSVNTKTLHVDHQVWNIRCSVNNGKKLSIEVFTPKFCHLGHSFYELGIMPNIQSRSLETTVVVLFDLTVSPTPFDNHGPTGHRQFSTLRPPRKTLNTLSTRPYGRGWAPRTFGSQRNRTKHPLAHVLIVCSSIDMIWGIRCSWGIRKSLIEPVRSILTTMFHLVGVKLRIDPSEPKTFWSSQLYLNQFFQRSYHRWQ